MAWQNASQYSHVDKRIRDWEGLGKKIQQTKWLEEEDHDTGDPWPHWEIEMSKVKVIRSEVKTASFSKRGLQLVAPPDE